MIVTRTCFRQKRHPVSPGLVTPTFSVALLSWTSLRHAVLGFSVSIQYIPRQVLPTLRAVDLLPLSLLVYPLRLLHPSGIGFICPYPGRSAWMADHHHSFPEICLQPHPVKESRHCVKRGLETPRVGGGYHPSVCIENIFMQLQPFLCLPLCIVMLPDFLSLWMYRFVSTDVVPARPFRHQGLPVA